MQTCQLNTLWEDSKKKKIIKNKKKNKNIYIYKERKKERKRKEKNEWINK